MNKNDFALQADQLSKQFAETRAVDDLSFEVSHGEIFGLLGPNGAGKTTTIRMALDIIKPTAGYIHPLGGPMSEAKKARIGYLPEERGLYDEMTVWDVLLFLGQLKELDRSTAAQRAELYLQKVELWENRAFKIQALSRGMRQKVQFVAATMHEPELIIVDEPFSGLDPLNTRLIKDLLYHLREQGATIILSTHQMQRVEEMCERILLLNQGRRVLYGQVGDIRRQFSGNTVEVNLLGELDQLPGVEQISQHNGAYRLVLADGVAPEQVLKALVAKPDLQVRRFEQVQTSLDEIFVRVVSSQEQAA